MLISVLTRPLPTIQGAVLARDTVVKSWRRKQSGSNTRTCYRPGSSNKQGIARQRVGGPALTQIVLPLLTGAGVTLAGLLLLPTYLRLLVAFGDWWGIAR